MAPRPRSRNPFPLLMGMLGVMLLLAYFAWNRNQEVRHTKVDYSFFLHELKEGNVKTVLIARTTLSGEWKNIPEHPEKGHVYADHFTTEIPIFEERVLLDRLEAADVKTLTESGEPGMFLQSLIYIWLPFILMIGLVIFLFRRSSDQFSSGMFGSFVKSPAKEFEANEIKVTFDEVAGLDHAKRELTEVVEFLKDPSKFLKLGAQIPKGVLLMGPPGTGKTLMARAVAGEAGVPFFSINGSEFIQMFVGVGASRVRDMFRTAKESAPCILFVDEIDAVGRVRGAGLGGGHDEREQTLNQILSEMDGFEPSEAVIVVAATNRPDVLDPALLRPGRFDRHVAVDRPSREGRLGILKVHVRKVPLADDVDLANVAAGTIGFSGAELKNLVNEAALNAARENKTKVDQDDFETARDKIMMGVERDEVLNAHEKRMTAYHEAGHALLGWYSADADLVHKVTIVPRGRALGVTQFVPEEERMHMGQKRLETMLAVALAGRAAEKMIFDEYSAGAESDIQRATQIARRMVGAWGMSEVIGPVAFRESEEHPFLGKEIHEQRKYSEQTAHTIDQEVQRILRAAQAHAVDVLEEHRKELDLLSEALLAREILSRDEMIEVIGPATPRNFQSVTERKDNRDTPAGAEEETLTLDESSASGEEPTPPSHDPAAPGEEA
ncbi:MAG: ATP-dependent zinc metalloprotease FtsH [Planctomycetaceae bacterium]|nr:ATP-dependent zinc metalloprotease FtsH [Planctomycetaceae bacterium]